MLTKATMYVLWVAPVAVLAGIVLLMLRRNLRRGFPFFFTFACFHTFSFVILFSLFHLSYKGYFYAFWVSGIIDSILGFLVMHEIFSLIFRPYDSLRELAAVLFRWAAAVLILVAIVVGASGEETAGSHIFSIILAFDRSLRVMQCGMVLFLLLFAAHVGLTKRHHVFGITLGFGVDASIQLIIATVRASVGPLAPVAFSFLASLSFGCAACLWAYYLRRPEPERQITPLREQANRWNFALCDAVNPAPQENFMSAVESAVERVLSKRDPNMANSQK